MATAQIEVTIIRRESNSFKNDNNETVEYHDALALDENGDLYQIRSSAKDALADLAPGTTHKLDVELRGTKQINVTQVRPAGAPSNLVRW